MLYRGSISFDISRGPYTGGKREDHIHNRSMKQAWRDANREHVREYSRRYMKAFRMRQKNSEA